MKLSTLFRRGLVSLTLTALPLLGVAALPDDAKETLGLIHYVRPTFPVLASSQGIFEGAAWVAVGWDEQGYARDVLVLRATHPTIGRAVEEAVSSWRRDPARREKPGDNFVIEFRAEGIVVASMGGANIPLPTTLNLERIPRRADLDAEPHAVQQPMPALSVHNAKSLRHGRVVVTFYVDETDRKSVV